MPALANTTTGLAARALQLSIEMRPLFLRSSLWAYPVFGATGAGFGYWLQGVDDNQSAILEARKKAILEKRARRAAEQQAVAA